MQPQITVTFHMGEDVDEDYFKELLTKALIEGDFDAVDELMGLIDYI